MNVTRKTQRRFLWRPNSRVFDPSGADVALPGRCARECAFQHVVETPAARALQTVYAGGQAPDGFCVLPKGAERPAPPTPGSEPVVCCMTSGSTGAPRLVIRSQASWCRNFRVNAGLWHIDARDSYAIPGTLSHSLSLYAATEALHLGAGLHLLDSLRPDRQAARLRGANVTVLYATPAQLRQLMGLRDTRRFPMLRLILVGGAKLDGKTRSMMQDRAPNARIREFYGASETSFVTLAGPRTPQGSVGQAYPGVTITVRDDSGATLPPGETGEIWVESPCLFQGYADGEDGHTRRNGPALTVGEFGRLDSDGHLWLAGRRGRMTTIADRNVFPEEVETCLLSLPAIRRAAVLASADSRRGHVLIACIEAAGPIRDADILTHCRSRLGPLKAPRTILRPDPFPTLASGKPDLATLEAQIQGITP